MLRNRRMMVIGLVAAGLCCRLSAGCTWPPLQRVAARVESSAGDGRVTLARAGERTLIEIYSPSGIGRSRITLLETLPPGPLEFRLHLAGLEHFSLAYGETVVSLAAAQNGAPVLVTVQAAGLPEQPVAPGSPHWMAVYPPAPESADPVYRVIAPPDWDEQRPQVLEIGWVDFYR
ncbi:MAG: hypothetical protein IT329_05220 [Caldilineaceae bacterium]|nr:hypothetical protein [Caldilineaceae bacterium]